MRRSLVLTFSVLAAVALCGCASLEKSNRQRQTASMLSFLYPGANEPTPAAEQVAEIRVPFRIGVAFVPDSSSAEFRLAEADRLRLAGEVRDAFARYPFVREIQAVPSMYLEPGGGFANLDRIGELLKLDVIALVSYDQVQNAGANGFSFLYWTGIGAYVIQGDQYDVLTVVDTAVLDIHSHRLLMRAGGLSSTRGSATWIGFSESARNGRRQGFVDATRDMISKLHVEVQAFRERAPRDPTIHLITPPGYNPNSGAAAPAGAPATH
jgi:rhombotail lipoprotein